MPHCPDPKRGHLLHPTFGGLLPPGPHVVVGTTHSRRVQYVAGNDDGLPRGGARPSSAIGPNHLSQPATKPLAPPRLLGFRPRRGLGPIRRETHGRARLSRGPGRSHGDARRAALPRRPGCARYWRAPATALPRRVGRRNVGRREGVAVLAGERQYARGFPAL